MEKRDSILLESGTNEMEILVTEIEGQLFGINVAKVKSIQKFNPEAVSPLPNSHKSILGILQMRDTTIPLIDMALVLNIPKAEKNDKQIVIVTEFNNRVNSFRVDSVQRIFRISWTQFKPVSSVIQSKDTFITGSVTLNGKEILILDLEQILVSLFPETKIEDIREEIVEKVYEVDRDGVHLLFAEDSGLIRNSVVKCLKSSGFTDLTTFEDGQYAYDHILQRKEEYKNFDKPIVLITDIEMPRMDGLALCNKIRKEMGLLNVAVVVFSSLITEQMELKCKSVGANSWVTKPESNNLIMKLDEYCA